MKILGLIKTSTVDYPGKLISTIFLGGCNLDCKYCHNRALVKPEPHMPEISRERLLQYLLSRKNIIEGICITGGEATLHGEKLVTFVKEIKNRMGSEFLVKLDTNGTNPEFLRKNLELFDYIAMDFKTTDYENCLKYPEEPVMESLEILKKGKVSYEVRITMYPEYVKEEGFEKIAEVLEGIKKVVIQQYRPVEGALEEVYSPLVLEKLKRVLEEKGIYGEIR